MYLFTIRSLHTIQGTHLNTHKQHSIVTLKKALQGSDVHRYSETEKLKLKKTNTNYTDTDTTQQRHSTLSCSRYSSYSPKSLRFPRVPVCDKPHIAHLSCRLRMRTLHSGNVALGVLLLCLCSSLLCCTAYISATLLPCLCICLLRCPASVYLPALTLMTQQQSYLARVLKKTENILLSCLHRQLHKPTSDQTSPEQHICTGGMIQHKN